MSVEQIQMFLFWVFFIFLFTNVKIHKYFIDQLTPLLLYAKIEWDFRIFKL